MPFLETDRQRAAGLIMALGVALVVALWPFSTGLIGAPVLLVVMAPLHRWLSRRSHHQSIVGITKSPPVRRPFGQRVVMVLSRV